MPVQLAHLHGFHPGPRVCRALATLSQINLPKAQPKRNVNFASTNVFSGNSSRRGLQTSHRTRSNRSAMALTSQNVTLPPIPELLNPNFLDVLVPGQNVNTPIVDANNAAKVPTNALLTAAITENRVYTDRSAPAFGSTGSATLDAFYFLNGWTYYELKESLGKSWKEDPAMTLRLIWNMRSIHDGKNEKELFYRAFGWLYDNHPRTALSNLHMLVTPVCTSPRNKDIGRPHGYWKDLLSILALATCGELSNIMERPGFLHNYLQEDEARYPRRSAKRLTFKPRKTPEQVKAIHERQSVRARDKRRELHRQFHERLTRKLKNEPKYQALYIAVARMFVEQIRKDLSVMRELEKVNMEENREHWYKLWKSISLVGKWAPSPGGSHDRVTNISTGICQLLFSSSETCGPLVSHTLPAAAPYPIADNAENCSILRSFYARWVLRPLRELIRSPRPRVTLQKRTERAKIPYDRISSVCMANNKLHFIKKDLDGFGQYMADVEMGEKKISGATLMPHDLVGEAIRLNERLEKVATGSRFPLSTERRKNTLEQEIKVVDAQWRTLVTRMKESGSLDNCIAVCDVSGSLDNLNKKEISPVFPSVGLSLMLAHLAKPPFHAGFITFSTVPKFVHLENMEERGLVSLMNVVTDGNYYRGSTVNLQAVFLDLLLPLAKEHNVTKQDMIKRIFVFSDMQFSESKQNKRKWETTHDKIEQAYKKAGYDVPEIVYWNTSAADSSNGTVEVRADKKGVALMSGFSPAMVRLFMGEQVTDERKLLEAGKEELTPWNTMKKALYSKSFDGLVVVD